MASQRPEQSTRMRLADSKYPTIVALAVRLSIANLSRHYNMQSASLRFLNQLILRRGTLKTFDQIALGFHFPFVQAVRANHTQIFIVCVLPIDRFV
jgi:hypothetical protein